MRLLTALPSHDLVRFCKEFWSVSRRHWKKIKSLLCELSADWGPDKPGCSCVCWAPGWAGLMRTWRSCRAPSHFCAACPRYWRQSGGRYWRRSTLSWTCDLRDTAEAPAPWSRSTETRRWNTWVMMKGIATQSHWCDKTFNLHCLMKLPI